MSAEAWSVVASLGSAVSAVGALGTAILMYRQLANGAKAEKEQRAAQFVQEYIRLSVGNPKLSTSARGQEYEWYVVATLLMAREVLEAYPNDQSWKSLVREHLGFHGPELVAWKKAEIDIFGPNVALLVADIVDQENANRAAKKPRSASRALRRAPAHGVAV